MLRATPARVLLVVAFLWSTAAAGAGGPRVLAVEPPGWWLDHSINPLRLLIHGEALSGATLAADDERLTITGVRTNASGTYAFATVFIGRGARPGEHQLRLTTASGSAAVPFSIAPPPDRSGRFQGFTPDDVIYLAMPDRFADGDPSNDDPPQSRGLFDRSKPRYYHGGDLRGVIEKLPYLRDLGVTTVWLNPWYDNVDHLNYKETYDNQPIADYHGYGPVNFYGVEEHLGSMADLHTLVEQAHRAGLKVVQDQVANHTGPYHPWVQDPPAPGWFNGTAQQHLANAWQIWATQDASAAPAVTRSTVDGWFLNILPDLDQNSAETSQYLIQNALWWVGTLGLDGVRQDTVPYVPREFWSRWAGALHREFPSLRIVGELFDTDPALVAYFAGGRAQADGIDTGLDSLFDFPLYGAIRDAFARGKPVRSLARVIAHDHLYPEPDRLVTFLGNHDVLRFMSEAGATSAGLELADTFLLTTRGIPQIYYGDEIGLPGGADPDNRRSMPGAFPGDPRDAFTAAGRTADEQHVFAHLRRLLHLRRQLEPLRRGDLRQLYVADQQYVYARCTASDAVVVAINNDTAPASWQVEVGPAGLPEGTTLVDRLEGAAHVRVANGSVRIALPPRGAAVFAMDE